MESSSVPVVKCDVVKSCILPGVKIVKRQGRYNLACKHHYSLLYSKNDIMNRFEFEIDSRRK